MNDPVDYFDSESLRKDPKGKTVRGGVATSVAQVTGVARGRVVCGVDQNACQ